MVLDLGAAPAPYRHARHAEPSVSTIKQTAGHGDSRVFWRERARPHARAEHRGGEACALLVRPVDDRDGRIRLHVVIVQSLEDLERGQHADDAVVLATGGLRVEVAAEANGRQRVVRARARREDVADGVDLDGAAIALDLFNEPRAHALVVVVQREPVCDSLVKVT